MTEIHTKGSQKNIGKVQVFFVIQLESWDRYGRRAERASENIKSIFWVFKINFIAEFSNSNVATTITITTTP